MTVSNLRRLEKTFLADQRINLDEARKLVDSAKDWFSVSSAEKAELRAIIARNADKMEPAARELIEKFIGPGPTPPPANTDVIRTVTGTSKSSFSDDTVFLGRDGTVHGEANVPAYTRGYDSTKAGPLRFHHGSEAPKSNMLTDAENAAIKANTPGKALDEAAKVFGTRVDGFEKMANSKDFYNENAEFWWGKCHAWAWSSLNATIDKAVDVAGPEGQKGLWVGGQFLSRADLGNWMMATADEISVADGNQLFKSDLSALDMLKGTTQFLMNNGGGMVSDVFNDKKKGHREVWNQPFVSSDVTTKGLTGDVANKLLEQATKDGVIGGTTVKQVTVVGTYGVEVNDDHEGEAGRSSKTWNMYTVCDANGKALTAYMADDDKLKTVAGLPTTSTDDLPDYIWKPTMQALDDTLAGKTNSTVENDSHGPEFKFFVRTVLLKGVPATTRTAFENDIAALAAGNVEPTKAKALATKYPGVANAYAPDQWKRLFQERGLDAKSFGATWPIPR